MSKVNLNTFVIVFFMFVFMISPSIRLALADPNDIKHVTIYIGDAPSAVVSEEKETVLELFTEVELYRPELIIEQSEDEVDSAIVRSRYVLVNFDSLKESESIVLNMFDDVSVTAVMERIENRSENRYTWFGKIHESDMISVILTVEDGNMAGYISFGGMVYQVNPLGQEIHMLQELCPCDFLSDGPDDAVVPPVFYPDSNTVSKMQYDAVPAFWFDDGSTIDVMVVYTDDVARASGNINAEIQLAIDQTNQSYEDSGIYQRLRLVHTAEVDYEETGNSSTDLSAVRNCSDGIIDDVCVWRDEHRADVVSFLVLNMSNACGRGYLMLDVTHEFEWLAYSVVKRSCSTSSLTFAHELGHNMGAHHDLYVEPEPGAYPYSHGYIWDEWLVLDHIALRSIMAYANWCNDQWEILSCDRIAYWSNPYLNIKACAWPLGWPCTDYYPFGNPDTADNVRTLNETAFTVANFRQSNLPPVCDINGPYFAECSGAVTVLTLDGTGSSDPDNDMLTYSWSSDCPDAFFDDYSSPTPTLIVNTSSGCNLICNVTLTVIDEVGLSDTCETTVTVEDTIPPDFELSVSPTSLWPPNHKMVEITPRWMTSDICDPEPEVSLVQITMNESGNGHENMLVTDDGSIYLRASRSGKSKPEGRIYTITYQACDCSGNCTTQSPTVTVPHDRRKK